MNDMSTTSNTTEDREESTSDLLSTLTLWRFSWFHWRWS